MTLKCRNHKLKRIFNEIHRQTKYEFCYSEKYLDVNKRVSVSFDNEEISKVLKYLLGDSFHFRFESNLIIIKPNFNIFEKRKHLIGYVVDENDSPLPGVTVVVKGTSLGVATDVDGKFTLKAKVGEIIQFSCVGKEKLDVKVKGFKDLKIVLKENRNYLSEVVCNGYQILDKRNISSSIQSLSGEKLRYGGISTVENLLQGRITGLNIIGQSSTPGVVPKIRIRGTSSISGNREPVWVVDGVILKDPVQIPVEELNSLDKVNLIGNAISFLNPMDIERIDILKDAPSSAIYGMKAANGVIVVTTKKGEKGHPRISFSTNIKFQEAPSYSDMYRLNSQERIEVSEEMQGKYFSYNPEYYSNVGYEGLIYDLLDKRITYNQFLSDVERLKKMNTDWFGLLFRNSMSQNHYVSISGGSENIDYFFSSGFAVDKGTSRNVELRKNSILFKVNSKIASNFEIGLKFNYGRLNNERPHSSLDLFQYAYYTSRAISPFDEDNNLVYYTNARGYKEDLVYNVFNELDNSSRSIKNRSTNLQFNVDWEIIKGINYKGVIHYSGTKTCQREWAGEKSFYASQLRQLNYGTELTSDIDFYRKNICLLPYGGEMIVEDVDNNTFFARNSLRFVKAISDHIIIMNAGMEMSSTRYKNFKSISRCYLKSGNNDAEISLDEWGKYAKWLNLNPDNFFDNKVNILSFYSILDYTFLSKYSFNFNFRKDGSNQFGENKESRFLSVWSAACRWNLSEELFLKGIRWLNYLSLRGGYGIQGNVHPDQAPYIIAEPGEKNSIFGENISKLYTLPNNKLKWEKTKSIDLGIDFSFFNNRFAGTVDIYKKRGVDQIIERLVSRTTGVNKVIVNSGSIENKGWDLELRVIPLKMKDFSCGFSFNVSKNFNKILDAEISDYTYKDYIDGTVIIEGKPVDSFYSYKFDYIDMEGIPVFKDIVEPEDITKEEMFKRVFDYSGKRIPDLTGGGAVDITYKNLSFYALFAFSFGGHVRLNDLYLGNGRNLLYPQQNLSKDFIYRWKKSGDEKFTNIPALSTKDLDIQNADDRVVEIGSNKWDMYNKSDIRVVSSDYIRCKNISIKYSVNKGFCKRLGAKNIVFNVGLSNPFLFKSSSLLGRDPEQLIMGQGVLPPAKTYNMGLSVTF